MSLKGTKRGAAVRGEDTGAGASKRRRTEAEEALWQLRPVSDLKMSSIYNRSVSEAPAELFRKDLISAMMLADSEPLAQGEYWVITDTWKQDWERGVQVPVNPDSLPAPKVKIIEKKLPPDFQEFKLPRDKYIHLARDAHYHADKHVLSSTPARAEAACAYDLDAIDAAWLKLHNAERARAGAPPITEDQLERVIEELEVRTWDKIQAIMKSEEGLNNEYDDVICDVCRSPDSEDGNEMVFCDSCNICVHQACYGITVIPDGQWLCRPCGDGVRPTCVLCPNLGGAMKCTPSGHKWAHVSCVLWIPEVSIGCAEKMEPITKISAIPASRWSLVCVLCRERKGACIQCSVKTCKTAYHVTCAFKHGLEMRAIIEDENADDGVKLRSYCQKHSVNSKKEKSSGSGSEEEEVKRKRRKDMTSEEKSQARAARLQEIEREFDRHVTPADVSAHLLDVDEEGLVYIYHYWKLKRRSGHNRPLLPPKSDDNELLTHRQEQADLDKMRMFVQLRQDLERVRNLCYMVSRREKLCRTFFRMREQTFHKQVAVLSEDPNIAGSDLAAIIEANHGPSIYDRLYSHPDATDHKNDFEELLARIAPPNSSDEKKKDRNGLVKGSKSNPYKKHYVNGSRRSGSMYSGLSSEESAADISRTTRFRGRAIGSSTDEDAKKSGPSPKKKVSPKTKGKRSPKKTERKKKKVPQSKAVVESSSEEDSIKARMKKDSSRSKTLQKMEKEMAAGKLGQSSDSDDLIPMKSTRNNSKFPIDIYSDSSDDAKPEVKTEKSKDKGKSSKTKSEKSPHENDSQQSLPRTKAAMKEFVPTQPEKKTPVKEEEKPAPKKRGRKPSNKEKKTAKIQESDDEAKNKENIKLSKQKERPTDLIVPQRQAAKKASENMRSTAVVKKEDAVPEKPTLVDEKNKPTKIKPKEKEKEKEIKDAVPAKVGRKKSSKEVEKEPISYVPQRQAAKKAAAHIKSGLGSKSAVVESDSEKKKDEKPEASKSPKKEESKGSKVVEKESSSSSSNSSSSSYSSSSSSEEEVEKPELKPTAKAREIKPVRPPSMFSPPPAPRPTVDLPFLDKVSRPLSSTSASSDSDSSRSRDSTGSSPTPKRPRRRRKRKSQSTDTSPVKALDKKLKTSERGPERGVPSPAAEGEESGRTGARAATRARTRSTASSGNMSNKLDAGQRKSSKDDAGLASGPNKTPKESSQPGQLPTPERKTNEEIKKDDKESLPEIKTKITRGKRPSICIDEKEKPKPAEVVSPVNKTSPRKSAELKQKTTPNRRMSVKEPIKETIKEPVKEPIIIEETQEPVPKPRRLSRYEAPSAERASLSPVKKPIMERRASIVFDKKTPPRINDDFSDSDKHWLPKVPSPHMLPPPVEKAGGHEKYMTEHKSLDADVTDKSSVKMIAKIQATLNENTMIKSPKTPMDARSMDIIDIENPMVRNIRRRSMLDTEKKFITQDSSHVQGVEISKSAKIPSAVNPFPNRSIFSPQPKDNEMFDFDMMAVDDGFNHDEMMKPFTSYPEFFFKEDSKEQGVQETLNLVDRLRMQLSSKKPPAENSVQDEPIVVDDDKDERVEENNSMASNSATSEQEPPSPRAEPQSPQAEPPALVHSPPVSRHDDRPPLTSEDKWSDLPPAHDVSRVESHIDSHGDMSNDKQKYDHSTNYVEDDKENMTIHSDAHSLSEAGDNVSLSKQSDDSQSHLSVVDHSAERELVADTRGYDNNNSVLHSDVISSPYIGDKWRESKIATRRSSASSTESEGSACGERARGRRLPDVEAYGVLPAYPLERVEPTMPLNQYAAYAPEPPAYLGLPSLPLFSAPLPSPGPPLYGPPLPYAPAPLIRPLGEPTFPALCAAFTSSSQNIALTTAMVAPPTPKPHDSPSRDTDVDVTGSDKFPTTASSPTISVDSYNDVNNLASSKVSNDSGDDTISTQNSQEPKSPPKPVRKFPVKSPGKSPAGISPKQTEARASKRTGNRSNRGQRGRGRSKSRAQAFTPSEYLADSIRSKLVGTVYDFDEEIANDGVDLKALRDKRKSIDVRDDRKSEHSYKESSQSPRTERPECTDSGAGRADGGGSERGGSPPRGSAGGVGSGGGGTGAEGAGFSRVTPLLPGPVDMRTYQASEGAPPAVPPVHHSQLLAMAASAHEQQLADIDEEVEKQLQSALMGSKPLPPPAPPDPPPLVPASTPTLVPAIAPPLPKVSLSDSRNQLKVKIKGPFLDANYASARVTVPAPPAPAEVPPPAVPAGTSLRRMRKKELLRQYWTQDMNMDEPAAAVLPPPPAVPPPLPRAVITIPKAVASMTSIPTREDYKLADPPLEKKKRKTTSGLSRELRHLEVKMNDEADESRVAPAAHKKRGRASTKPAPAPTPKLKIKIGSDVVAAVGEEPPPPSAHFRPPKKRLVPPLPKPSLEDLRRESMKYRRMVMADFAENEKVKKSKPGKSEKRKKKKDKKAEKLQVVNSESESATKLIIKIKRPKEEESRAGGAAAAAAVVPEPPVDPFEYDPTAPDPLAIDPPSYSEATSAMRKIRTAKVTPIRLKLARSSQGSGYVMKGEGPAPDPAPSCSSAAAAAPNKHCEVR